VAILSNIIQKKTRFRSSYYCHPLVETFYRVKGRFFQKNWSFKSSKNAVKKDHRKRSKADNLNLHCKRAFIEN